MCNKMDKSEKHVEWKKPYTEYILYNFIYVNPRTAKYMMEKNRKFWLLPLEVWCRGSNDWEGK